MLKKVQFYNLLITFKNETLKGGEREFEIKHVEKDTNLQIRYLLDYSIKLNYMDVLIKTTKDVIFS